MTDSATPLRAALLGTAGAIRDIERQALAALHEDGDKATYEALLREKCDILMQLPVTMEELVDALPEGERERVEETLDGFARRAGQAVSIGSIFYMSALLYPDNYQDGQNNDLEDFAKSLQA